MSHVAFKRLVGMALVDRNFCEDLLNGKRPVLLGGFDFSDEERQLIASLKATSIREFTHRLYERLEEQEDPLATELSCAAVRAQ